MGYSLRKKYLSRRTRGVRLLVMASVFVIGYLCYRSTDAYGYIVSQSSLNESAKSKGLKDGGDGYRLPETLIEVNIDSFHKDAVIQEIPVHTGRRLMADSNESDPSYPKDAFTLYQRRNGAVVLHIFGMIYMFVALAVVCDEFFVPSLGVITKKLDISEDVSGATFMAAGGSAPELFTSIIGVFIANNDVGIGTIVGSAVFNILFVIGMCALFSSEILALTWWPLFRDVSFYSVSLLFLIGFFSDDRIEWWEALILFMSYVAYVTFMKYNSRLEMLIKTRLSRCKCLGNKVNNSNERHNEMGKRQNHSHGVPYIHAGSGHYRHGVVQLMIHTIDPVTEAKIHDKAMQLQATLRVTVNPLVANVMGNNNSTPPEGGNNMQIKVISNGKVHGSQGTHKQPIPTVTVEDSGSGDTTIESVPKLDDPFKTVSLQTTTSGTVEDEDTEKEASLEEEEEPLDISWPTTTRKRLTYIFLAPIILPLYITLPDVRRPDRRMFFPWTFIGSVLWIAGYSYCMVWWANQTGETIGIPDAVMGLTVLAAGTSIPDLITSVIVAKKGFGDMAVSSSVGSNIFDITIGLPVPWLMYSAVNSGDAYIVVSKGMLCSIFLLFLMLVTVIASIAFSGWKMSKGLGISMLCLYLVFMTLAVLLEYELIVCPAT